MHVTLCLMVRVIYLKLSQLCVKYLFIGMASLLLRLSLKHRSTRGICLALIVAVIVTIIVTLKVIIVIWTLLNEFRMFHVLALDLI